MTSSTPSPSTSAVFPLHVVAYNLIRLANLLSPQELLA
jgi:hypothetical protein